MCNGTANKFHKVVLHGETLVFVTTVIVATVAEVESEFKKFHETDHVTRCNACLNMFRNAVAHKFQLKVSICKSGFNSHCFAIYHALARYHTYLETLKKLTQAKKC